MFRVSMGSLGFLWESLGNPWGVRGPLGPWADWFGWGGLAQWDAEMDAENLFVDWHKDDYIFMTYDWRWIIPTKATAKEEMNARPYPFS